MSSIHRFLRHGLASLLILTAAVVQARVLDDFNAGKTGWEDFSFVPQLPPPQVDGGQFKFALPPLGQSLFIASTKTSETFELKNDRTIEFRVDMVTAGGKDSFGILAFIPTSTGASTLAGYGLAKSTTDVLITKGIGKYFYNENPPEPVKNENVTLSLTLAARNGTVTVTARVLDKDNNDAVLFEKTVVDTPAADVMADGTDEPATPFLTEGRFVLYLYEDFDAGAPEDPYQVAFDNAEVFVTDTVLLDDFNSGKSGWEDFSFNPALPIPQVTDGQFQFILPPVGQALFIASTKTTSTYALREGERLELQVDMVRAGGKDSFGIVAFIPTSTGASTLAGYGLAKSTTDILITKGIGKYFYNENPPEPIKNENITLSLTLTARGGRVAINAQVLDLDNNRAVLFDKTFIDTPAADVLADGTDEPAAPFITEGRFVLYLYEDFDSGAPEDPYQAVFDNARVGSVPTTANPPPVIAGAQPANTSNFLPSSTTVSFQASDDQAIPDTGLSITLNGTVHTVGSGLTVSGAGNQRTVTLAGALQPDLDYTAVLKVVDAGGEAREQTIKFDTFNTANPVIEVEDYNFSGGQFINNPEPVAEGGFSPNGYANQEGIADTDFHDTRTSPNAEDTLYRMTDPVRMARSLDRTRKKYSDAGGSAAGVYDYDVGDLVAAEWMNYTRTFANGTYQVYLRSQIVGLPTGDSVLERVTGDPTQPDAATSLLGTFLGRRGGFDYQNVPLTDGAGLQKLVLRLSGTTTLRLRHITSDPGDGEYRLLNYLVFVPVTDTIQRPAVSSASPSAGATVDTVTPVIDVAIQNRDTTVNVSTVKLAINGVDVTGATVTATPTGATLNYRITPLPPAGATLTAKVSFLDSDSVEVVSEWQFTVTYRSLDPATRLNATGVTRGFKLHVVQAPIDGGSLENSLDRAETQLAPNSSIPRAVDTNTVVDLINFNKTSGASAGAIPEDVMVPGIDPDTTGNGDNDFAVEILTFLELPAGVHRFGVVTDDGYKLATGTHPVGPATTPLAFHNGGPANEAFDFVVSQAGIYPFRMVWYERGGSGHGEWTSIDTATETRLLINDPSASGAIKAWADVQIVAVAITLESAASVAGPYAVEAAAVVNEAAKTVTVPVPTGNRFYRLRAGSALTLRNPVLQGGNLVLAWQ